MIFGELSLRFGEYHIYFTNILPKKLLKKIANADSEVRRSDACYIFVWHSLFKAVSEYLIAFVLIRMYTDPSSFHFGIGGTSSAGSVALTAAVPPVPLNDLLKFRIFHLPHVGPRSLRRFSCN